MPILIMFGDEDDSDDDIPVMDRGVLGSAIEEVLSAVLQGAVWVNGEPCVPLLVDGDECGDELLWAN